VRIRSWCGPACGPESCERLGTEVSGVMRGIAVDPSPGRAAGLLQIGPLAEVDEDSPGGMDTALVGHSRLPQVCNLRPPSTGGTRSGTERGRCSERRAVNPGGALSLRSEMWEPGRAVLCPQRRAGAPARGHGVPFSSAAFVVLGRGRWKTADPGSKPGVPRHSGEEMVRAAVFGRLLKDLGIDRSPHGFRSSFRSCYSAALRHAARTRLMRRFRGGSDGQGPTATPRGQGPG